MLGIGSFAGKGPYCFWYWLLSDVHNFISMQNCSWVERLVQWYKIRSSIGFGSCIMNANKVACHLWPGGFVWYCHMQIWCVNQSIYFEDTHNNICCEVLFIYVASEHPSHISMLTTHPSATPLNIMVPITIYFKSSKQLGIVMGFGDSLQYLLICFSYDPRNNYLSFQFKVIWNPSIWNLLVQALVWAGMQNIKK